MSWETIGFSMDATAPFLLASTALLILGAIASVATKEPKNTALSCTLLFAANLLIICLGLQSWGKTATLIAPLPFYLGVAPIAYRLDSLSAVFTTLLGLVGASTAVFSSGYLQHLRGRVDEPTYWTGVNIFVFSMLHVVLAANALTFLLFWELMSLSSATLVAAELASRKAQHAALIYLGATRIATALLAGGFLWLYFDSSSWDFSSWHLNNSFYPALLVALGLCIKAGIWPFHIWLPYAHPAAPSPVSSLMSGVMIKVAIYAMIRFFIMDGTGSLLLASLLFGLGTVSAVWGVLFALVQQDLKRLLAYSSVENVGLILVAIATCTYAQAKGLPELAAIGLAAALFHCVNHGIFKSLLFLCAGTIDARVHTRELNNLGGLAKALPYTMACFLVGSTAICALPPSNGFASKWLVYQGLFKAACQTQDKFLAGIVLMCIGTLALVGALALACFTKAFSISFLGRARTHSAQDATEGTPAMILPQTVLTFLCFLLGALSPQLTVMLSTICPGSNTPMQMPALPLLALTVVLTTLAFALYFLVFNSKRKQPRKYLTWECGYGQLNARMQVTAESFAHSIARVFTPVLQYATRAEITGKDRRHFPDKISAEPVMVSLLESKVYGPFIAAVGAISTHFSKVQAGSIHLYLLYVIMTLVLLLVIGIHS